METFQAALEHSTKLLECLQNDFPSRLPNMNLDKYFPDEESERKWKGPFTFVLTADTQFGLIEKYIRKKPDPRWDEEIRLTTATINCVNKMRPKPRFLVVCGDMLDSLPKDEQSISLREEQYDDFVHVFQELDSEIPLICACGNHDIGDEPTAESYRIYKRQFGPDFYSFWVGGVKFCVVNSQYFKRPNNLPKQFERQEKFLSQISDPQAKFLVVFQHIPFFVSKPGEDDVSYLNIEKEMRYKFMDVMDNAGVDYIFCGHYHRNGGGCYKNFHQIITTALGGPFGEDPSGFRLCHVTEHGIYHQYIPVILDKVPRPTLTLSQTVLVARKSRLNFLQSIKGLNSSLLLNLNSTSDTQPEPETRNVVCLRNFTKFRSKDPKSVENENNSETSKSALITGNGNDTEKSSFSNIFSLSRQPSNVMKVVPPGGSAPKQVHKSFSRQFSLRNFFARFLN